jgi:hypothetical protein
LPSSARSDALTAPRARRGHRHNPNHHTHLMVKVYSATAIESQLTRGVWDSSACR